MTVIEAAQVRGRRQIETVALIRNTEEEGRGGATLNKLFSRLLFVIRDSLARCQPVPDAVGERGP